MMKSLVSIIVVFFFNTCQNQLLMPNPDFHSPSIIEAVKNNQLAVVESELKKGANVNISDEQKSSLLLIATAANHLEMAKLLIRYKADVNQQNQSLDSPFLLAGANGQADLINLFLANGARFDIFNRYNGTALIPACERAHTAVVKILSNTKGFPIDHINRLGWTALMEAVVLGNGNKKYAEIVQLLVDAGCNVNIPDQNGVTALQHAKSRGYSEITAILQQAK